VAPFLFLCHFERVRSSEEFPEIAASQILEISEVSDAIEAVFSVLGYGPFDVCYAGGPKP